MNKSLIISQLSLQMQQLLTEAQIAAQQAHLAAVDEQSKAETQYDTLAIESAYLAEGQSKRIEELSASIELMTKLSNKPCSTVSLGAVFSVEFDEGSHETFYLSPTGAGQQLDFNDTIIKVITPAAPLAKSCLKSRVDDEISVQIGAKKRLGVITKVY